MFFFYLDDAGVLKKASFEQTAFGKFDFHVVSPMKSRKFTKEDWFTVKCKQIPKGILNSSNDFLSFM